MTPSGGHVPERRRRPDVSVPGGKREDDPSEEVAAAAATWARHLALHRGRIVAVISVLGPLLGSAFGYLVSVWQFGGRVDRLEAVTAQQTADIRSARADITDMKNNDALKTYLLCSIMDQLNGSATPKQCDDFLSTRLPMRVPLPQPPK